MSENAHAGGGSEAALPGNELEPQHDGETASAAAAVDQRSGSKFTTSSRSRKAAR
jgi:hypothetical protein